MLEGLANGPVGEGTGMGEAMDTAVCGDRFREMFSGRAVAAW